MLVSTESLFPRYYIHACTINITGLPLLFHTAYDTGGFFNTVESESNFAHSLAHKSVQRASGGGEAMMIMSQQTESTDVRWS